MSALRGTGRLGMAVMAGAVTMMLLAALAVSGCDPIGKPGGPRGTGVSEDAEALKTPADVRTAVINTLKAHGQVIRNEAYVFTTYTTEVKDEVIVSGAWEGAKGQQYTSATLLKSGKSWTLVKTE